MRTCTVCKEKMDQGYCIDGGTAYYCTDKCLHTVMTSEEWDELYEEEGDSYWTEWDEDDTDEEEEEILHVNQDDIICPYCGYANSDEAALLEMENEISCQECDKRFVYATTITHTTYKMEEVQTPVVNKYHHEDYADGTFYEDGDEN